MKYWRGYLTAAIIGFFSWALIQFAQAHTALIDMVYPYVTRMLQTLLADWSSSVSFCLWQFIAIALVVGILTTIVLAIVLRWNLIQLVGWYTALASLLFFTHTATYGLNNYAGSIANDIRLRVTEYSLSELEDATIYYRDQANTLASSVKRDAGGDPVYPTFQELADQAGTGFDALVYDDNYSIFAGCTLPVKELGWADLYTSMGIAGFTMSLTGEAAVNPQIPVVSMPFSMCREMAHRMSIATESDANMAAFLACYKNPSVEYQYSAYFMAYYYCYNALMEMGTVEAQTALNRVKSGMNEQLYRDLSAYNKFFTDNQDESATKLVDTVNDAYNKIQNSEQTGASHSAICDLLVSWHIQTIVLPSKVVEDTTKFDPYDETQVDLSGIVNAPVQEQETEPTE